MQLKTININEWPKKLENGNWQCDRVYKKVRIKITKKTKAKLLNSIKERIKMIEMTPNLNYAGSSSPTFIDLFEIIAVQRNWCDRTYAKRKKFFNRYFSQLIDLEIIKFTNTLLLKWINGINVQITNKIFNVEYANRIIGLMRAILLIAKNDNYLSPSVHINQLKLYKTIKIKSKTLEENYMTYQEFQALCKGTALLTTSDGLYFSPDKLIFMFVILYFTGARINEARAIKVNDFKVEYSKENDEIEIHYITINKQLVDQSNEIINHTKANSFNNRKVYLKPAVYDDLMKDINYFGLNNDDFIFDFKKTGQ